MSHFGQLLTIPHSLLQSLEEKMIVIHFEAGYLFLFFFLPDDRTAQETRSVDVKLFLIFSTWSKIASLMIWPILVFLICSTVLKYIYNT